MVSSEQIKPSVSTLIANKFGDKHYRPPSEYFYPRFLTRSRSLFPDMTIMNIIRRDTLKTGVSNLFSALKIEDPEGQRFPKFQDLPGEIRNDIWTHTFPNARIIKIEQYNTRRPARNASHAPRPFGMQCLQKPYDIPALRACREARDLGMKRYKINVFPDQRSWPMYFDFAADSILFQDVPTLFISLENIRQAKLSNEIPLRVIAINPSSFCEQDTRQYKTLFELMSFHIMLEFRNSLEEICVIGANEADIDIMMEGRFDDETPGAEVVMKTLDGWMTYDDIDFGVEGELQKVPRFITFPKVTFLLEERLRKRYSD